MAPDRSEAGHAEEQDERDVGATSRSPSLDPPPDPDPSHHSPSSRSVLVLFRGLPGVGKSTLARAVSLELGNAPLVDKDDARDALAEVFSEREDDDEEEGEEEEEEEEEEEREQGRKKRDSELFRQRLNEASYAAAFNAARTLLTSSRCPCVLLDSPLSRASAAERALRLAEELNKKEKKEKEGGGDDDDDAPSSSLAFVVVAVGNSDEGLWRRRLEARAAALTESGSHSARHKPRRWAEVEALRDRGRRELLEEEEEEEEKEKNCGSVNGGGGGEREQRGDPSPSPSPSSFTFRERMLRDLGVDRPSSRRPFSRLWRAASARFVVDTAAEEEEEERKEGKEGAAFMKAAAGSVAAAVRSALAGGRALDDDGGGVVFLER